MSYIIKNLEIDNREYHILIGKNAKGNEDIIKISDQNDIWFHIDNISGPHIILQNKGDLIHKKYLNYIASMFKEYKSNLPHKYTIIYTEVKNVKLTSTLGQVKVSNTKKIKI
jgi:predicted ribosome quality control (RQC) complex YloA/Tae2 family protein